MIKVLLFLLLIILLIECDNNEENINQNTNSKKQTQICAPLNIDIGYSYNKLTHSLIKPIINFKGDTIITGQSLNLSSTVVSTDSLLNPKKFICRKPKIIFSIKEKVKGTKPKELYINSFRNFRIGVDTSKNVLVNSQGKRIKTNTPLSLIGFSTKIKEPKPIKSKNAVIDNETSWNIKCLDINQGLSSSYIYTIVEDRREDLWFGTYGAGVCRYDGVNFTRYTVEEGLSNNTVWTSIEDSEGNIWFGTEGGGICVYNGESFTRFSEEEGFSNNIIKAIIQDSKGNIWIGTRGGGVCKYRDNTFTFFSKKEGLSDNNIWSLFENSNGDIWFGTEKGVNIYDGQSITYLAANEGLSNEFIRSMTEDKNGQTWIGTEGGGVYVFDGKFITNYSIKEGLSNNKVRSMLCDNNGLLWLGTEGGGVNIYNRNSFSYLQKKDGLSDNDVRCIVQDNIGNIWFGTEGGGISILNNTRFEKINDGLSDHLFRAIIEDSENNLWFGSSSNGIIKFDGSNYKNYNINSKLPDKTILSIIEDKNKNIWFGTYGEGAWKYDGREFLCYNENSGLSGSIIRSILEDSYGNIWFGSEGGGITKFDGIDFHHFNELCGLSDNTIWTIVEDLIGNIWFGTWSNGIIKFDGKGFTFYTEREGLSSNHIRSLAVDKIGNIWIGTHNCGLMKFDGKQFVYITEENGLSNNIVWSIVEDDDCRIWVTTENGLNLLISNEELSKELNEEYPYKIISFDYQDGLKGLDFFANSVLLDSKNILRWGSGKGLIRLDANKFNLSSKPPTIKINYLEINEQYIDYRNLPKEYENIIKFTKVNRYVNLPQDLVLPYTKNHLTFHFSGHDKVAQHKLRYSYKIENLDDKWSTPSFEPKAEYRNLPHGKHIFTVKSIGESQLWSKPYRFSFIIKPPWWKSIVARISFICLFIISIFLIFKWRTNTLRRRQKELEIEVTNATEEITLQKNEIEEQQKAIQDSILYAKRIQSAIMPTVNQVKNQFLNSFILYKPKDILAGDFYWLYSNQNHIYIAAADCTGHGVPGAIVSVVCINALNRSVKEFKLTETNSILNKVRELIINEFEKSQNDVNDGMDISLCKFDNSRKYLEWSGANNSIWIIPKGSKRIDQIIEIKGDKQPIGRFIIQQPFTSHNHQLNSGDSLYIFSDGFVDQFGGPKDKKFKSKQFKILLLDVLNKSMNEQKESLDMAFENWKGDNDQVDDVCVIGIRV